MIAPEIRSKYELVVGLEVHAQLLTESKAFSTEANEYGALPNTHVSVITLAHPGTLPRPNKKAAEFALRIGLACGCDITRHNIFARKNYFYPDLPKGYQITQDKTPICRGGGVSIKVNGQEKRIGLTRIHLEEDAGKSLHLAGETETLVDYNRAGVPLIEIVSEPEIRTSDEAYAYLTEVRRLVRYLDICDGNMEEGSLRCDANISVRPVGQAEFGVKVEVKNMNSIRNVQRAIDHEVERQIELIERGETVVSETRNFDATTGLTSSLRSKEALNDYRYFPEPDLGPLVVDETWIERVRAELPALPQELIKKFTGQYGLSEYDAAVLTDHKDVALYFEELCQYRSDSGANWYKAATNWVMGPVKSYLNELTLGINDLPLRPAKLAELIALVDKNKVSYTVAAQQLFPELMKEPTAAPEAIAQRLNVLQESDAGTIQPLVDEVLASLPGKVAEYRGGKVGLLGLFVGEVMKRSKGKADPRLTNDLVRKALEAESLN